MKASTIFPIKSEGRNGIFRTTSFLSRLIKRQKSDIKGDTYRSLHREACVRVQNLNILTLIQFFRRVFFSFHFPQICESRGKTIPKDLAAVTIKHVYQNPRYGFDANEALDVDEVQRLVSICKDRIVHDHGPVMETLRMQVSS